MLEWSSLKRNINCGQGCGEKDTPVHCWWEYKLIRTFLEKLETELLYDLAIYFLGIYPKEMKTGSQRDNYFLMFTATLFTIGHVWKQWKCWSVDKEDVIYKTEYYSAIRKKEMLPFATM